MSLIWVHPEEIDMVWPQVSELLEKAMQRTGVDKSYDVDFVRVQVKAERFQCWVLVHNDRVEVAHISTVEVKPKRKILNIPLTGAIDGSENDWVDQLEHFKEFARENGCSTIRGFGRYGWIRTLKPDQWRVEFDIEV